MSDFKYELTITGTSAEEVNSVIRDLEDKGIIPNYLQVEFFPDRNLSTNLYMASLGTENFPPYGTISCWPAEEHGMLLHELSQKNPDMMFELSGENIDDPNNGIFKKAFQNGLYKEAYQEKQDIDFLLESASWRNYGTPEREGNEAEVYLLYETICSQRQNPLYSIASDMAWMEKYVEPEEPLTTGELYTLASKLNKAWGEWFTAGLLHEEHLDAIKFLLEQGLREDYCPDFPIASPEETRKLLLTADNQVFGTLVETAAIYNQIHFHQWDYEQDHEDILAVNKAIEKIQNRKTPLNEKIASAHEKAVHHIAEQGMDIPLHSR